MTRDISNKSRTHEIMKAHGFKLKKKLGQNFLTDANILRKIVETANLTKETGVIEIGPGIGALTEHLARHAKNVLAYEIDPTLIPILEKTLGPYPNIKVINEDILKADITADMGEYLANARDIAVVANLPYYITTPILMGLIEARLPINRYIVMMQMEVARRLSAKPGTKDYNALSIAIQYYCDVEIAINVPRGVFIPPPNVDSAVVLITRRNQPPVTAIDEDFLMKVIHISFTQRRKTLLNNLANHFDQLAKAEISELLQAINIDPSRRAESLTIQEFAQLSDTFLSYD